MASPEIFAFVIVPLLIFLARVVDVSMGTMRIIFVAKGFKNLAPVIGFFEVLIWLVALTQIMQNLTNIFCYLAYAGGFAFGTFIGIYMEERIAFGTLLVRVITKSDATELIEILKEAGYGVTVSEAQGTSGLVHVIYIVVIRKDIRHLTSLIRKQNPNAFYTLEDIRFASQQIFSSKKVPRESGHYISKFRILRKGK
ncbi:MAG: DUF2179 domain-containing protein [archaeon]